LLSPGRKLFKFYKLLIKYKKKVIKFMKYECELCGHVYDPDKKREEEISSDSFPDNWTCPVCGLSGFVLSVIP
jgi:rubredoxin